MTFISFIDDYSKSTVISLLSQKNKVYDKLKDYIAMLKKLFGRLLKAIRPDNGGEISNERGEYLRARGIRH